MLSNVWNGFISKLVENPVPEVFWEVRAVDDITTRRRFAYEQGANGYAIELLKTYNTVEKFRSKITRSIFSNEK